MMVPSSDFDKKVAHLKGSRFGTSQRYNQVKRGLPGVGSYNLPSMFDKYWLIYDKIK